MLLMGHGTTPDLLRIITSAAGDVDVCLDWFELDKDNLPNNAVVDMDTECETITTATTETVATGGTDATRIRNVKEMYVRNVHASISNNITVVRSIGGTEYEIWKETLLPGETLEYKDGVGFYKPVASAITNPVTVKRLAADQSNSTTTPTEVTGLTQATGVGTFIFEYFLLLQSAATTTGHKLSCNYDGSETSFAYDLMWLTAATTASDDVVDQDHVAAPGGVFSGFSARVGGVAGIGQTTDVDTANADVLYYIFGIMVVTVAGNLELWHGSEAAAASTVKAGSSLRLTQTA